MPRTLRINGNSPPWVKAMMLNFGMDPGRMSRVEQPSQEFTFAHWPRPRPRRSPPPVTQRGNTMATINLRFAFEKETKGAVPEF